MKPLPLAMFARNWMRPVNPAKGLVIGAMVAVMCGASLVVAVAADADPPCDLWTFNGYTQFDFPDGGKMTFISWQRWIYPPIDVLSIPPNGGPLTKSSMYGGNDLGNIIWLQRHIPISGSVEWFNGGVTDDGFAYGIAWDNRGRSSSWRSAAPLRCCNPQANCP
jgi:hypothetical protein